MIRSIDVNILIAILASDIDVLARVALCGAGTLTVSSIAYAEVRLGIERDPVGRDHALDTLAALTRMVPVMPFDAVAGEFYALVPFRRHRFDRLIAAHVLSLGATLVTYNARDFADVPGLRVEDWS